MYVSLTKTKGSPDQPATIATIAGEEMLPWLRQMDGFDGLLMLTDEETATTVVLAFWEDRAVAERHRTVRAEFRGRVTAAAEVTIEETADYEVSFVHLGPLLARLQG